MGGFGLDGFGRCDGLHRGFGFGFGGFDGFDGGFRCGRFRDDEKKIAIITAIRAVIAKGDGCFDGRW